MVGFVLLLFHIYYHAIYWYRCHFLSVVFRWESLLWEQSPLQRVQRKRERRSCFQVDWNQMESWKGASAFSFFSVPLKCFLQASLQCSQCWALYMHFRFSICENGSWLSFYFPPEHLLTFIFFLPRTWRSAQGRRQTKLARKGSTRSPRASSPGLPTTRTQEPMSWEKSSRTTSGPTLCSTTWCAHHTSTQFILGLIVKIVNSMWCESSSWISNFCVVASCSFSFGWLEPFAFAFHCWDSGYMLPPNQSECTISFVSGIDHRLGLPSLPWVDLF